MDVEAAGRHEEVQKERARAADWTLKRREDTKKSKKSEPEPRIGRQSGGKHGGSPKGVRKSGGMDVEAAERQAKVQKGFVRTAEWTSKRRKGKPKSKKSKSGKVNITKPHKENNNG